MATENKYTVTSKCHICGCPVELVGGPKINVRNFQGAKNAECSICNPKSEWKRVQKTSETMKRLIDHLVNDYKPGEVVDRVIIQNVSVPISRENALMLFGCKPPEEEKPKVHVVAFVYQGVLESVHVFAEGHLKVAQDKETAIKNSDSFHENEDTVGLYENVEVE